jgi:hypothetical protein
VDFNAQEATNAAAPTTAQSLATRAYVDAVATGLNVKNSVRAASTANGTLATAFENGDTMDGITLATGDRILLKNQTSAAENGIRIVAASGAPARATDMDAWSEVPGAFCFVTSGTANGGTGWITTAAAGGTLDSTSMPWTQFSASATIVGGSGLTLSGNTLDVNVDGSTLEIVADTIRQKDSGTTAAKLAPAVKPSGSAATTDEALRALGSAAGTACAGNDARLPTAAEKSAFAGTTGTPGSGNKFVTDTDPRLVLVVATKTADYTLAIGDANNAVEMNSASAHVITVPPNSSVAFAVGATILLTRYGAGALTVAQGAGVTIRSAGGLLGLRVQYSTGTLVKRGTDEWYLFGDLV